ncbi:MAG: hypothetical protein AB7U97_26415 [Pirellulales bacterium]
MRHEFFDLRTNEGKARATAAGLVRSDSLATSPAAPVAAGKVKAKRETRYGKRHRAGEMNGTEAKYAELLSGRKLAGEIVDWMFEPMTFRLADRSRYTPDFMILHNDTSIELVNVKGGGPIDPNSLTKHKVAAEKFSMFRWTIEQLKRGEGWVRTEF